MRGRSSSAKSRLRSAGYKCNLCGRRLIDAATLVRHQKAIHNVSPREHKVSFKPKPSVQRSKLSKQEKDRIFDNLLRGEVVSESKSKSKNRKNSSENQHDTVIGDVADEGKLLTNIKIELVKNGESSGVENEKKNKKNESKDSRRVEFECPVCAKTFGVYFTAHKHIQRFHSTDKNGKKMPPNSIDLIQPIRVEECCKCNTEVRSDEQHSCSKIGEEDISLATDFVCSGCNQIFVSLKTFDMHVAGLHSDAVDSMFFPTRIANKYYDLLNDLTKSGYVVNLYAVEVGARGIPAKSLYNLLKDLGLSRSAVSSILERVSKAALAGSYQIWLGRERNTSSEEFMNWRLEMERQTSAKYTLYGEYESKKIYHCSYARKEMTEKAIAYVCPSSIVVQDFSKGIQVHFYNKHYGHTATIYTLSSKYKKYSITSFLKNPNEDSAVASAAYCLKLDDKDLHSQFKKLMESIVLNAVDVDVSVLKILIEKALEMSDVVSNAPLSDNAAVSKQSKNMSDKEITDALELKTLLHKRRKSVDSCETSPKPAKRTRNKSLFNQSDIRMSPKILNTFSLASNVNSDGFKSDTGDDFQSNISDNIDKVGFIQNKNSEELNPKINKSTKINMRLRSFHESLSFNDSYKNFIDNNLVGRPEKTTGLKSPRNKVKTKLGAYKQTSPRKVESKDISQDIPANNKNEGEMKETSSSNDEDEEPPASEVNTSNKETKANILSGESPTFRKGSAIKMEALKVTNSQINFPKIDTPKANTPKINSQGVFSQFDDLFEVNVPKMKRLGSSKKDSIRRNVSRVRTRSSSPLLDPLELNIRTVKPRNSSVEPLERNISKAKAKNIPSTLVDPLKVNTPKEPPKSNTTEIETPKLNSLKVFSHKLNISKPKTKAYIGPVRHIINSPVVTKRIPKLSPRVTFEDETTSKVIDDMACGTNSRTKTTTTKDVRELKYEVREQENDCNILVLKF